MISAAWANSGTESPAALYKFRLYAGLRIQGFGVYTLGLLAHLLRFGGWGGCQGGLTTEPEDMVGALGIINPFILSV